LYDGCQKTWKIKPFNESTIDSGALRVNGHKLEDLLHQTKFGRDNYKKASDVLVEVENWLLEDNVSSEFRLLVGQNINFDKSMLEQLWLKCDSKDTFPFGRRTMDTMMIEFFLDWCKNTIAEGYSLNNLTKKYGVKNEKAHTAEADVKATKEVFEKQIEYFKKVLASQK
jgi:DNA polymerase III epsilon subunit-like protein